MINSNLYTKLYSNDLLQKFVPKLDGDHAALGIFVLATAYAQLHGVYTKNNDTMSFKCTSKARFGSIVHSNNARKTDRILLVLSLANWLRYDKQNGTIIIPKWSKYQEILKDKKGRIQKDSIGEC